MMVPRVLLLLPDLCLSEVAEARICAGFLYRFSTIAGREIGRGIGNYAAKTILVPRPAAPTAQ